MIPYYALACLVKVAKFSIEVVEVHAERGG